MNTSTNETDMKQAGGAFADGLTLLRVLLTPIIMFVIIAKGWPSSSVAALASMLFAIAAITDIFDNITGGAETSRFRKFGWFDDIADTVLVVGTLLAMIWVLLKTKTPDIVLMDPALTAPELTIPWIFIIPAGIIIAREAIVGLIKGFEFSREGWSETRLGDLKNAFIMFGTCLLLASPWLNPWLTGLFAGDKPVADETTAITEAPAADAFNAYINTPDMVWTTGTVLLWIGAILALVTGFQVLTRKSRAANDS